MDRRDKQNKTKTTTNNSHHVGKHSSSEMQLSAIFFFIHLSDAGPSSPHECCHMLQSCKAALEMNVLMEWAGLEQVFTGHLGSATRTHPYCSSFHFFEEVAILLDPLLV